MKLTGQRKAIYDYLTEHGEATIVELREALYIAKPCMRISEINRLYPNLIVTLRKKPNGEHVKGLAKRITKQVSQVTIENGVAVERLIEVSV
jgi:hypothetical protein